MSSDGRRSCLESDAPPCGITIGRACYRRLLFIYVSSRSSPLSLSPCPDVARGDLPWPAPSNQRRSLIQYIYLPLTVGGCAPFTDIPFIPPVPIRYHPPSSISTLSHPYLTRLIPYRSGNALFHRFAMHRRGLQQRDRFTSQ